ncbi:MAG: helix-turn-helix transcriptional regulator [Clostridium sp.]|nr:helix-turn-helix transcriptional regulator [Clostridium sp.]
MQLREAIVYRIKTLIKEYGLTEYSLSIRAGIPPSTLNDFFRGKVVLLRIDNILHICEGFNIELKDFFDDPVFKNVEFDRTILENKPVKKQ